ncbi:MAG: HEPN domain-containing protein [bacterium]|nr:HEPN domain-containing protein [bacterium]
MAKAEYVSWLTKAFDDLSWTKANIKGGIWYGACFSAQQAAEKALKAYLLYKGKRLKKIHSLVALLEECRELDPSFEKLRTRCARLTVYYVTTRYPDIIDFAEFSKEKAVEALELAKRVVGFVEEKFVEEKTKKE